MEETAQDPSVDGAVERFPEWPRLRQQYCRIRKTAIGKRYREGNHGYLLFYNIIKNSLFKKL